MAQQTALEPLVVELPSFLFIGIGVSTNTESDVKDIGNLWDRFISEHMIDHIPEYTESTILTLYTNYRDGNKSYDAYVGCRVRQLDKVPVGFKGLEVEAGKYHMFLTRGPMPNAVADAWGQIREMDLERTYRADWDVYGPKAQNEELSEVEIFVSIK